MKIPKFNPFQLVSLSIEQQGGASSSGASLDKEDLPDNLHADQIHIKRPMNAFMCWAQVIQIFCY